MTSRNGRHRGYLFSALFGVALLLSVRPAAVFGEEAPLVPPTKEDRAAEDTARTTALLKQVSAAKLLAQVWPATDELTALARRTPEVEKKLQAALKDENEQVRLAAARALCRRGRIKECLPVLLLLLQEGKTPKMRAAAANVIGPLMGLRGNKTLEDALAATLKKETDEWVKLAVARCLLRVGNPLLGEKELLWLLLRSREQNVQDEAALALAAQGGLSPRLPGYRPYIRRRLFRLSEKPTARGARAYALLRTAAAFEAAAGSRNDPHGRQVGEALFREVFNYIRALYPDEKKVENEEKLYEAAVRGLVASLDPFSQYMDRRESKDTEESLKQDYGGIGAYVGLRDGLFVIESPIFGSPADRAGLEALDVIFEVDGVKTSKLLKEGGMRAVIAKLKGKPGTQVRVKYMRRGFLRPVEVVITRARISIDTVFADMLPGKLGYIRLSRFGEKSASELRHARDRLLKEGARGLVLDLRNNPGGLLKAAVEVGDLFLNKGRLIVYQQGRKGIVPRTDYFARDGEDDEKFPVVVLVNGGSASAAEIVSGALQDHHRAVLVGQKTFGKGSVQQLIPLRATNRETQLRLTVAKYYLPSGRCIHEKGIEPNIKYQAGEIDDWTIRKILDFRQKKVFRNYVYEHWDKGNEQQKAVLRHLADDDGGEWKAYPGFEKFYKSLNEPRFPRDRARIELRRQLRRKVEGERKKEYVYDLESDEVLQRGIFELLKEANVAPGTVAAYKSYPEKFKPKPAGKKTAALPEKEKVGATGGKGDARKTAR